MALIIILTEHSRNEKKKKKKREKKRKVEVQNWTKIVRGFSFASNSIKTPTLSPPEIQFLNPKMNPLKIQQKPTRAPQKPGKEKTRKGPLAKLFSFQRKKKESSLHARVYYMCTIHLSLHKRTTSTSLMQEIFQHAFFLSVFPLSFSPRLCWHKDSSDYANPIFQQLTKID